MKIVRIDKPGRGNIEKAVSSAGREKVSPYLKNNVIKNFASNPHCALYAASGQGAAGCAFRNHLQWDSKIFGFKIGRLEGIFLNMKDPDKFKFLKRIIRDCKRERYAHLHCRIGPGDPGILHALKKLKFNVADTQVTLSTGNSLKNMPSPVVDKSVIIRKAVKRDLPYLKELVKGIFIDTRFVVDPGYPRDKVDRMYYEWVKNSVLDPARSVFVVWDRRDDSLAGVGICATDPGSKKILGRRMGFIDLVAVKSEYRNKGIGKTLVKFCLNWLGRHCDTVEIRTQVSNAAAMKTFMKSGFVRLTPGVMLPEGLSLHRWFKRRS